MGTIVVTVLVIASVYAITRGRLAKRQWRSEDAKPGHIDYRG
jgi:hypothetical protein